LKLAGSECGLFVEKSEISHRHSRCEDSSNSDILRLIQHEAQRLLEHHQREMVEK